VFVRVDSVTDETIYRPSKPDTAMLCMFETATIDLETEPDRRAGRPKNNGALEE